MTLIGLGQHWSSKAKETCHRTDPLTSPTASPLNGIIKGLRHALGKT